MSTKTLFVLWVLLAASLLLVPLPAILLSGPGDSIIHFAIFCLGALFIPHRNIRLVVALAACAVLFEVIQIFIPTRTFSLSDMGANLLGVSAGVLLARIK